MIDISQSRKLEILIGKSVGLKCGDLGLAMM
jgi:hypothetical protein